MKALERPGPRLTTIIFTLALFALTLSYTGAGFNLHLLSIWGLVVLTWFALILSPLELDRLSTSWGWLPAVMAIYFAWLMAASWTSSYPYASFTTAMGLAVLPLIFLAQIAAPAKTAATNAWLQRCLLSCGVGMAVWGIADFAVMRERAHASFLDANAYAALINLFLIPVVYMYLGEQFNNQRTAHPWLLLSALALLALAQSMALSRGALVAFLAALTVVLWLRLRSAVFWSRLPWLLGVLATTYICANVFAPTPPRALSALLFAPEQAALDSSIHERLLLLKSAWQMLKESNLLIGDGLGTFKILYPAFRDPGESSAGNFVHNDYLQALQEGGVIQLSFLVLLTVIAPLWLLVKRVVNPDARTRSPEAETDIVPGLLIAVGCASLHALVNFIHYVGPLAFLIGLYLAYSWEAVVPRHRATQASGLRLYLQPRLLKALILLVLAVPVAVLAADGVIFKIFGTTDAVHASMSPTARMQAINVSLAFRSSNPMPRILLIRALLAAAENTGSADERAALLAKAEREIEILSRQAPALALAQHYFPAKVLALRGSSSDLARARDHLEQAVRLVPPATTMRLELVRTYVRLGQTAQAHQTIAEAKKWVRLEVDLNALAEFANEAQTLSRATQPAETEYWSYIQSEVARVRSEQKLTTAANPVE